MFFGIIIIVHSWRNSYYCLICNNGRNVLEKYLSIIAVAPFVGAWIEIYRDIFYHMSAVVAPFVGAWIEISLLPRLDRALESRSLRGSVD